MKTIITLSIVAITALLIGCGGGGGGGGTATSSTAAGGTSTSSTATGGATSSASNQETGSFTQFDARNLSGNTVFVEDKDGLSVSDKEHIYIFETGTQVKIVVNRNDGGQVVYDGTYQIKDSIASLYTVEMNSITGDSSSIGFSLFLDDNYNIKENQLGAYVTKILANESNGVNIKDSTPTSGGLTVNSVDDVKGYTITSNVASPGSSGMTTKISIAFNCNGSFDYHQDIGFSGTHHINDYHGDRLSISDSFGTKRIHWYYEDEDGEESADVIETDVNDQILEGACWYDTNADGTCSNDIEIASITGSGC